jgi:hypothetical protein
LLNAEVAPRLEKRGCEVFATMRVGGELPAGMASADVHNVYVFNALMSLEQGRPGMVEGRPASLCEYLRARPYPAAVKGGASLRILVFDQFEEVFTSFAERWSDRAAFFDDVGAALEEDPRLRVIFAMREEYIGGMDTYASRLPERLRTRFRLERLGAAAALLAVTRPLDTTDRRFKPEAARTLVDNLLKVPIKSATGVTDVSGEYVEPLHLQLVCTKLWNSLPGDVTEIDERYIEDLGDVDEALAAYYEQCVRQVVAATGVDEGTLRAWFERTLITADGVRGIVPKGATSTGGLANDVLDRLQKLYLIRVEMRGINPWYELTHDRFVAPIRSCNELWRSKAGAGKLSTLELEARAGRWAQDGRAKADLLSGEALTRTKALLASPALKAFGVPERVKEYVQASELADSARRRWRDRIVLAGVVCVVGGVAYALYLAKSQAEDATAIAQADVARKFARQPGLEFDAVAYGMRAVHPGLDERRGPPVEAIEGLRAALTAVGHDPWLRGLPGPVTDVGIAPDGKLAFARSKGAVCGWEARTGKPLYACLEVAQEGAEPDVFFSPDRRWIYRRVRAGSAENAQIWDARTGKSVFEAQLAGTRELGLARDGAWAAAYGPDTGIRVLDLAGGSASTLKRSTADLGSVAVAPGGASLATIATNGDVELWKPGRGRVGPAPFLAGNDSTFNSVVYAGDAARVAITSVDFAHNLARARVFSLRDGEPQGTPATIDIELPPLSGFTLEFAAGGRAVVTLTARSAQVWDAATGAVLGEAPIPAGADARLLDDGRVLLVRRDEGRSTLAVVDPRTGTTMAERTVAGEVTEADVARDLQRFVAIGRGPVARVYPVVATPVRLDALSAEQLFSMACEKVRFQREFTALEAKLKSQCGNGEP